MNFEIKATSMADKLASTNYVDIDWSQRARQLEKVSVLFTASKK